MRASRIIRVDHDDLHGIASANLDLEAAVDRRELQAGRRMLRLDDDAKRHASDGWKLEAGVDEPASFGNARGVLFRQPTALLAVALLAPGHGLREVVPAGASVELAVAVALADVQSQLDDVMRGAHDGELADLGQPLQDRASDELVALDPVGDEVADADHGVVEDVVQLERRQRRDGLVAVGVDDDCVEHDLHVVQAEVANLDREADDVVTGPHAFELDLDLISGRGHGSPLGVVGGWKEVAVLPTLDDLVGEYRAVVAEKGLRNRELVREHEHLTQVGVHLGVVDVVRVVPADVRGKPQDRLPDVLVLLVGLGQHHVDAGQEVGAIGHQVMHPEGVQDLVSKAAAIRVWTEGHDVGPCVGRLRGDLVLEAVRERHLVHLQPQDARDERGVLQLDERGERTADRRRVTEPWLVDGRGFLDRRAATAARDQESHHERC